MLQRRSTGLRRMIAFTTQPRSERVECICAPCGQKSWGFHPYEYWTVLSSPMKRSSRIARRLRGRSWRGVGDGRSVGGAHTRPGLPRAARSVCGGCRGSNARFRSSLRWLDALEASITGTRPYDAEALKREKPPIATMFATRCSDRIRVRDRRLARLSRDVTLTYTATASLVGATWLQGRVCPL